MSDRGPFTDNVKLPAGCNLIVSSWAMHRNPELFPDPEQFRPERFVKDDGAGVENPYSFVPFSAGESDFYSNNIVDKIE